MADVSAFNSSRGWGVIQDPDASPGVATMGILGSISNINRTATGSDQTKEVLERKTTEASGDELISLATNTAASEGARGVALSFFKARYQRIMSYQGGGEEQSASPGDMGGRQSTTPFTVGDQDYAPKDTTRPITSERFNQITPTEKLTRLESRLSSGREVNPQRLAETLNEMKANARAAEAQQAPTNQAADLS